VPSVTAYGKCQYMVFGNEYIAIASKERKKKKLRWPGSDLWRWMVFLYSEIAGVGHDD
jgi:hypothetical protein